MNKDMTGKFKTMGSKGAGILGFCAGLAASSGGALAPVCAVGALQLGVWSDHAEECLDKNPPQCLKLQFPPFSTVGIPYCVGKKDGCC